jgi:FAD/FMN-containing dehydrogenase
MENKYHLIVEYESDKGQLANEMYDDLMRLRDEVYPSLAKLGYVKIEDPKILLHKFIELVDFLESGKVPFFGHLGSGIIHPVFRNGEDERIGLLMKYVRSIHGSVSGEHGIGLRKREFLDAMEKKLIERVKKRHDPLCKINCGKVIAKSDSPALESQDIKKEKILEIEKQIDEQNKQAEKTQEEKHDSRV